MNRLIIKYTLGILCLFLSFIFVGCSSDDDDNIGSTKDERVLLDSFGPYPASRGGLLCFFGTNLDKVKSIDIPGCSSITDIDVKSSGINSEIRVVIPLEESEVGYATLNLENGTKIATDKEVIYSEPISVESLSSLEMTPGDEITIKGEYLYLVTKVLFANDSILSKELFTSQSRHEIKFKVPVNACSGKFIVASDAFSEDGTPMLNEIPFIDEIIVKEPEVSVDKNSVEVGDKLTITGSLLRLIKEVKFEGTDPINVAQEDPTKDVDKIVVTVPNGVVDGDLELVLLSGRTLSAGNIKVILPEINIANTNITYGIGDNVIIKDYNFNDIKSVNFVGADNVEFSLSSDKKELIIPVVAAAKSGNIILRYSNGSSVIAKGFVTTKPKVTIPAQALEPLEEYEFISTLGSRVKSVRIGDSEAKAKVSDNGFKITIPYNAVSGKMTIVMDNGEEVEAGNVSLSKLVRCAISNLISKVPTVGQNFEAELINDDLLTGVMLDDAPIEYNLNNGVLSFYLGRKKAVRHLTLLSGEKKANYLVTVDGKGLVEYVVWKTDTPWKVGFGWAEGSGKLRIDKSVFNDVPVGSKIKVYVVGNGWGQFQLCNNWFGGAATVGSGTITGWGTDNAYWIGELTQADLDKFKDGMGIQGQGNLSLTKISIIIDYGE